MSIEGLIIGPDPITSCNHEHTREQEIDLSHEEWQNGEAQWIEQIAHVKVCARCGAIYNPEAGRWEK